MKIVLLCLSGSHSYGLETEQSDIDIRGIYIPNKKEIILGSSGNGILYLKDIQDSTLKYEKAEVFNLEDAFMYEIKKYISLCKVCNPNILELLFIEEKDYIYLSAIGSLLRNNRDLFLSKECYKSFRGYAQTQLRKIETHKGYLLEPPLREPEPSDFGLESSLLISKKDWDSFFSFLSRAVSYSYTFLSKYKKFEDSLEDINWEQVLNNPLLSLDKQDEYILQRLTLGSKDYIELITKQNEYRKAKENWKQYNSWKLNRNTKRRLTEEKVGYDTKYASHLLRLYIQGEELLRTGNISINRKNKKDWKILMDVKQGLVCWQLLLEYERKFLEDFNSAYKESKLPNKCENKKIDDLLFEILEKEITDKWT